MDHASNRFLSSQPVPGESAYLSLNAVLMRHTPTLQLDLQPSVSLQRYSNNTGTNSVNRAISASATRLGESWTIGLSGAYSDQSTLNTELTSTGLIQGTRQRSESGGASWQWQHSPKRQFTLSLSYADVSYVGRYASLLPGYEYPSASAAEHFTLSEQTSLAVNGSVSQLRSTQFFNGLSVQSKIREEEASLTLEHTFSDRLSGVLGFGRNDRSSNGRTYGYVGQASLSWKGRDIRNRWKLAYARTVSPTGFGVLAQRDDASLYFTRELAEHLSASLGIGTSRDVEGISSQFNLSRRYEYARAGLNWTSGETSTIGFQGGYDRATTSGNFPAPAAHGWEAGLNYTWKPLPQTLSR